MEPFYFLGYGIRACEISINLNGILGRVQFVFCIVIYKYAQFFLEIRNPVYEMKQMDNSLTVNIPQREVEKLSSFRKLSYNCVYNLVVQNFIPNVWFFLTEINAFK